MEPTVEVGSVDVDTNLRIEARGTIRVLTAPEQYIVLEIIERCRVRYDSLTCGIKHVPPFRYAHQLQL